ncbi:MAG: SRPBCC family protein [Mycobacteriales bacterium]
MQRIHITHDFVLPVERVYAYLSEHENLGPLFGAKIRRVRDGSTSRNGAGSVRELRLGPLPPFQETVVEAEPDKRIVYRITQGSPLRGHRGEMTFAPLGSGTRLDYVIEFGAVVPGLDRIVKVGLERTIRRGLTKVDAKA